MVSKGPSGFVKVVGVAGEDKGSVVGPCEEVFITCGNTANGA